MNKKLTTAALIASLGVLPSAGASNLLTSANQLQLQSWLDATGLYTGALAFTKVFENSTGKTGNDFHTAVNGLGPTITLLSATSDSGITNIIRGFDPISWLPFAPFMYSSLQSERTAFIFDLDTRDLRSQSSSPAGQVQTLMWGQRGLPSEVVSICQ